MDCPTNYIAIIDVLGRGDHQTGQALYDNLAAPHGAPIHVRRYATTSRAGLLKALELLGDEAEERGECPLLHIEGHGSPDALHIGDLREKLRWSDFAIPLRRINLAVRNSLVVVLAACHGMWLTDAIRPFDAAPFVGLIAPNDVVNPASFVRGFPAFYHALFEVGKFSAAIQALRQFGLPEYFPYDAATLFADAWRKYATDAADAADRRDRAEGILERLPETLVENLGGEHVVLAKVEDVIRDIAAQREQAWRTFTMADVYPDNASRFAYALASVGA